MRVMRYGFGRHKGESSVVLSPLIMDWRTSSAEVKILARKVLDFNKRDQHNYEVTLSLEEIGQLLNKLGEVAAAGGSNATAVAAALSPQLASILRLVAACVNPRPKGK